MKENKVLVGMSGGVDSAAAAVLLGEAGYEAVGCTLRLYDGGEGGCCSLEDVEDARSICRRLGMDFFAFNFSDLFRRAVVDDFVSAYQAGRTPNPCIQCNRHVKFAALLRRADELEIGHIATGHYARVDRDPASGRWRLLRGLDRRKDQSYVLYPLTQGQLSRLLLPLGAYDKASVRALAEARGLCNARKPDSQDICFVPDGDYPAFLRSRGTQLVPGDFVDAAGRVLHRRPAAGAGGQRGPAPVRTAQGRRLQHRGPGGRGGALQPDGLGGGVQLGVPAAPGEAHRGGRQDPLQPERGVRRPVPGGGRAGSDGL